MSHTEYTQFSYDPDNPEELAVTRVPQPGSCAESVLAAMEREMAVQFAKDAEQYARQEQEKEEQAEELEFAHEMAGNAAESDESKEACNMAELEETAEFVPEASESSKAEQPVPADDFLDDGENVLPGGVEGIEELKSLLSGCKEDMEKMNWAMARLEKRFDSEILNAQNRDSAVKAVYKEMNEYKAGLVEKALKNVLYDIVDFRETMLSQIRFWREKKDIESISLKEFESYADDLADILERYDVTIYKGEPGQENTAVRQKIVRKVETEDDALVKKVAESLSYGYEYNTKVLYPEKISIYVKKK